MGETIHIGWANQEETCIVMKFKGRWTIAEYRRACNFLNEMIASKTRQVHVMIDLQCSAPAPAGIIKHGASVLNSMPGNTGKMIFISKSRFWKTLVTMIEQVYSLKPLDLYFVDSANDAYQLAYC